MRSSLIVVFALLAGSANAEQATVAIDNQWVRTTRVILAPHEKLASHDYPPTVVIYLSGEKNGKTAYFPAGPRALENASDMPLEEVVIELKPGAGSPPGPPITRDPVKLDPKYHTVDFENPQVRILRTVLAPHIKSPMHQHPAYVVVYITELHTTMALGNGKLMDNVRKRGEIAWRDAMDHSTENIGDQTAMEIQVELK